MTPKRAAKLLNTRIVELIAEVEHLREEIEEMRQQNQDAIRLLNELLALVNTWAAQ